ncbi:MAG: 3-keto-5-aminohexanoate cleavage protein [Gemmatimonadota bacterium]
MASFAAETPCVVSAAITGAFARKDQLPWLPCTPEEIATSALGCWKAGAAICHIHVRKPDGTLTHGKELFAEVLERVRAESDLNLNFTTSKIESMTHDDRFDPVELGPELATFNSGSLNFGDIFIFENSPVFMRRMALVMRRNEVRPEFECFDTGHIGNIRRMIEEGYFEPPYFFQLVMLPRGTMPPRPGLMLEVLKELPEKSHWMTVGVGRDQLPMNSLGIILGGHVRTGFEDNLYFRRGEKATSNAQMVARVVRLCNELNRPVATAEEARQILGLRDARNPASRAYERQWSPTSPDSDAGKFFAGLPNRLSGPAPAGVASSYQFLLRGETGGHWWLALEDGKVATGVGERANPGAFIVSHVADWMGVVNGTHHPIDALQGGKILMDGKFAAYVGLLGWIGNRK